jgi:transcriptional regulator with XRE-family HTH domain
VVAAPEQPDIGRRLRQVRHARGKSLAVIAGLAGISAPYLSMIERGERALDRRSLIVKLANALEIAPSDLTGLPVPAPADGDADANVDAVRQALMAVSLDRPGGQVLDLDVLRERVAKLRTTRRACQDDVVGQQLPGLIHDLHATIASGRHGDGVALAELAVSLHVSVTVQWLRDAGAPADLRWHAAALAELAAQRLDDPLPLGVAAFGTAMVLLSTGAFDLARQHVEGIAPRVSTGTDPGRRVAGMLALTSALLAATQDRYADADAPLDEAAELARRTGEDHDHHSYWSLSFGPSNVEIWRASIALEAGDHDRAIAVGKGLRPEVIPSPKRRAAFLIDHGRALARLRGRREDAVLALRAAERLSPMRVHRNPIVRDVLAELLVRTERDAVGRELRGLAYRAGVLG